MLPTPPRRTRRVWLISCGVVAAIPVLGVLLVGSLIYMDFARRRSFSNTYDLIGHLGGVASTIKVPGGQTITAVVLDGTELDDAELKKLARRIPDVEHLRINGTLITDKGLPIVERLSDLTHLEIVMTEVTPSAVAELQRERPNLNIVYSRALPEGHHWTNPAWQRVADLGGFVRNEYPGGTSFILDGCSVTNDDLQQILDNPGAGCRVFCIRNARLSSSQLLVDCGYANVLNLTGTKIDNRALKRLGTGGDHVRYLALRDTRVTDEGLRHLNGMRLVHLDLRDTKVSDAGIAQLQGLTSLKLLRLQGTNITRTGVRSLRRSMPETTIEF